MVRHRRKATTKFTTETKKVSAVSNLPEEKAPVMEATNQAEPQGSEKEFDFKKAGANDEVMQALFEMAKSGKNTTAAIFWAKARCGMRERPRKKTRQVSQVPSIVIRTEEGKQA